MALTLAEAVSINPPSVASRCITKSSYEDPACQPCSSFFKCSPCSSNCEQSGGIVQFQLTYTCDRSIYAPCYRPIIPNCYPSPVPIRKTTCCCLKWHDCCGNQRFKS
ncbi:hypothetical protein M0802_004147 [Mischocyttarus mexicanus]|nr:hypothetical protein M0802_004147 [Mischocyttarus mexicanus]